MLSDIGNRHLVSSPEAFHPVAVQFPGPGPAFGRSQNDHGPGGAPRDSFGSTLFLDCANLIHATLEDGGQLLVNQLRIVAFNGVRRPAVTAEKVIKLLAGNPRQYCRIGDLVTVQVQDGKDRTVPDGVEKFVRVPGCSERPGFRFAVADYDGRDEVGIIKCRSERVRQAVAKLATLMNGSGRLRRAVASNATRKRKLAEKFPHSLFILAHLGVNF